MARYFQKLAEARWRKHLDKLEGDELYDMAHKMSGNTDTMPGWWGDTGQKNLASAYRNGITDKRVIKAIVSDAGKEITPSYKRYLDTRPVTELSREEVLARKKTVLNNKVDGARGELFYKRLEDNRLSQPMPQYWGESAGIDPEKEVKVVHGGGERHIKDVIDGKKGGYALEKGPLKGLQVHPLLNIEESIDGLGPRTKYYANGGVRGKIDNPASLVGTIKAKFLHSANNGYEAGLPAENIKHLKNAVITRLQSSEGLSGTVKNIIDRISKLKR